jgi:hypothetical protein
MNPLTPAVVLAVILATIQCVAVAFYLLEFAR